MDKEFGLTRRRRGRSWVVTLAMAVFVLGAGLVLASGGAALWQHITAEDSVGVVCDIYPIALPDTVIANAQPGAIISEMPRGTGAGNYSWLTWTGDPSAPTLAGSLVPPGNSQHYIDPDDGSDTRVDIGDWVQGAAGSMNASQVRSNLQGLLHQDIVVPAYDSSRGQGNNFDYRVKRFAVIRLRDFKLTGHGWLSFEFRGFKRCYNKPPVSLDQSVQTPEETPLAITLAATDSQNDPLTFEVMDQPRHGTLSGTAPDVVYTPAPNYNGPDQLTFRSNDGQFDSNVATVSIEVLPVNDPPRITSTPVLEAADNRPYTYLVTAEDVDIGDVLTFALANMPEGMTIDPQSGVIRWTPTIGQVGEHAVTVTVTDRAGASDSQTYVIVVIRSNQPPTIVSAPVHDAPDIDGYRYLVEAIDPDAGDVLDFSLMHRPDGMSVVPGTGVISWNATGWRGNNRLPNTMCMAGGEQLANLAPAADVVVVVDESGSMSGEHDWIADFAAPLEAHLATNGVGAGAVPNRYGLIGYEADARPIAMPSGSMGSYQEFIAATPKLRISGGTEDGWRAVRHALVNYPLREQAARNIILVTDEDRDNADPTITYASIFAEMKAKKAVLNAVVNARFKCGDGVAALGLGQNKVGYKADGRGGFLTCPNASVYNGSGTTVDDYVKLALETGGAAWDIEVLRDGGTVAQSFTNALLKIKVQEILQQLPTRNLPDVYVHGLQAYRGAIQVDVGNRGLAAVGDSIAMQVFADDVLIDVQAIADLPAGALQRLTIPWHGLGVEPQRLSAKLLLPPHVTECKLDNNTLDAAWVRVRATDRGGLFDEQAFSVQAVDQNEAPRITSLPTLTTGVSRRYDYAVTVADPDRGDAVSYALGTAPIGAVINRLTGQLTWIPDASQQGQHTIEIVVRDLAGAQARQSFRLTVDAALLPPRFSSIPERRAVQGTTYTYIPKVTSDPSAQLSFDVFLGPSGFTMDPDSGRIQWAVPPNFAGKNERVVLRVRDQYSNYDLQIYTLLGDLPNQAPRISSTPGLLATVGSNYAYNPSVTDVNVLETTAWRADVVPPGATLNAITGSLSWLGSAVRSSSPAAMAAANPFCLVQDPAVAPFAPRSLWANTRVRFPGQPLVGPLADTDLDGELTSKDLMAVIAVSQSDTTVNNRRLHAFNARTGQTLWSYNARTPDWSVQPAMADLEGEGALTILFVDTLRHLVALRSDGTQRWVSTTPIASSSLANSAVSVTDLDGDGVAEVLVGPAVFNAYGLLKWQFTANANYNQGNPAALDLDGDGRREVLFRGEIRDANGVLRKRLPSAKDGTVYYSFQEPIVIPGSGRPHLVISEHTSAGSYRLSLTDAEGNLVWVKNAVGGAGPVLIADFTGDGVDDIYVAALNRLYSIQGELIWTVPASIAGATSNFRAAVASDIDRDGQLEILSPNATANGLLVLAGRSGAVLWRLNGMNDIGSHTPALVDMDGTGDATLFVSENSALRAYKSASLPWHSAARVIHQQPFALDQVRSDMRPSPVDRTRPPSANYVVGRRQLVAQPTVYQSDLRVSAPYGVVTATGLRLSADVSNRGTGVSQGLEVAFYRGDAGGVLLGKIAIGPLAPGQAIKAEFATTRDAIGDAEVTALVLTGAAETECEIGNNVATGRVMQLSVTDHGGLEATQSWVVGIAERMLAPTFASTATTKAVEHKLYRYVANAISTHLGDVVIYDLVTAPDGASINPRNGEILWVPRWGLTGRFSFVVQARSLNGQVASQSWSVDVAASTEPNQLPRITSSPIYAATINQAYRYDVRAVDPEGQAISYSLGAAPAGMQIDALTGTILWLPQTVPATPVEVRVIATDERQGRAEQSFSVRVYATPNRAPTIASVPTLSVSLGQPYRYAAVATDPDGDPLSYVWNVVPVGVAILSDTTVNWTPTAAQVGEHIFELEVRDDRGGWARQQFTVFVNDPVNNSAPQITSVPNPRAAIGQAYTYGVAATDADSDALKYELSERPQGMSIDPATGVITWTPIAAQLGDHTVKVQVADGRGGAAWQRYTVQVSEHGAGGDNSAPEILSAPANSGKVGYGYRYDVQTRDLDGDVLAYSLAQSPAGMQIDALTGRIDWVPTQAGEYNVRVRVSDGALWTEQGWALHVVEGAPLSARIELSTAQVGPNVPLLVSVVPANAASQVTVVLRLDGVVVPMDSNLTASVRSGVIGRHELTVTVSDSYEITTATTEFLVLDPNSSDGPTVSLSAPLEEAIVTAPMAVMGAVADADLAGWKLSLFDRNGTYAKVIATGSTAASGELGTLDPTSLLNGQYVVVLQAWDQLGHEAKAFSNVVIEGEMKLGHFSLSFEDVSIPVMGIPLTVTRTYDTRRSGQSLDFGHGWSVDYQNVRIHESRTIGLGWSLNQYRSGFFSNWCVQPMGDPVVTIALPDGKLEKFRAKAVPECQFLVPNVDVQLAFEPLPGTYSKLERTSYGTLRLNGNQLIDLGEGEPADPNYYRLTTKEGMAYDIDQRQGIRKVTDLDGNSLTYSRDGVVHSSGVGVQFIRDSAGRIITIRLPDGNFIDYTYDAKGDLSAVVDQVGGVTRFGYLQGRFPHYLQDIIDPRGVRASRNEYDDNGRLIAHVDAEGRRIEYTIDLQGRTQIIKDRLGNSTTYAFDDNGRVLQEINALGEVTKRTYDQYGNETSRENGEGEVWRWEYDARGNKVKETNPLGQVTTWRYDDRGQVLTQTDAAGTVTANNVYNSRTGQLTSMTDALGLRTDFTYSTSGNLTEMRQPLGVTTAYVYDSRGNKLRETNALGVAVEYTYDSAGRVLTEARRYTDEAGLERTLVTQHTYDAKGRRIATVDPMGNITRVEYNAIDKESAQIDVLGRRTELYYDAYGNLVETRYPDGTTEAQSYDAENHLLSKTDRAGRTTATVFDAAGRLVETRYPDGAVTKAVYDKAGRELTQTDARGNVTRFTYDDSGRLTTTTNPLNQVTTTAYNTTGTKASVRDALNRVTKFVYDAAGRLIETIHPDSTTSDTDNPRTRLVYDALGRKTSQTDEMGRVTAFEYTSLGQLAAVVDATGQRTAYGYDESGHKITQTDALGRVTRWVYDAAGREVARVLPGGQRETKSYDANGNLVRHVDFNGAQTVRSYDSNNRIVEVRHADGTGMVTTYTATGQVATQTDAAGVTVSTYDARDRLLSLQQPDGVSISYAYDAAGNRTRLVTSQQAVAYTFDATNRLATVVRDGQTTAYGYDAVGNRGTVTLPNGARSDYTYDLRNRLKTLLHRTATGAVLLGLTYTTDASGLRTQVVEQGVGATRTIAYQYDTLKRLTREQVTDSTRGHRTSVWTYDAVGNRLTQARTKAGITRTTTYAYDSNDRLQREQVSDGTSTAHQYDANGSLIGKTEPAGQSTYSYDGASRLVDAITPTAALSYRYDANGIRQSQTVNGLATRFVVDPVATYAQVIEERPDASAPVLHLVGDDRIARSQGAQTTWLHGDGLGSTRLLTAADGAAGDRYWFEAFGETEVHTGSSANAFLFAGEQMDPNLGFYYLRARYLDSGVGRFISADSWPGTQCDPLSLHDYIYAHDNPTTYVDPSGHFIGLAGGFANIGFSHFQAAYLRSRDANRAYQTYNRIVGTLCKSVDKISDRFHGHHARPKYLGGPVNQDLADVSETVHRQLHSMLSIITRLNGHKVKRLDEFNSLSPSGQADVLEILKQTTRAVDAACVGVPGYSPIYPKLDKYL